MKMPPGTHRFTTPEKADEMMREWGPRAERIDPLTVETHVTGTYTPDPWPVSTDLIKSLAELPPVEPVRIAGMRESAKRASVKRAPRREFPPFQEA